MNARSRDLQNLLCGRSRNKNEITKGNHRIAFAYGWHPPSTERCAGCPNHLSCFAGRQHEILRNDAERAHRACYVTRRFVAFYYHGSCCLIYDTHTGRVSDLGMWGYSVTTSRAIRWYLEAIADNFPTGWSNDRIQQIIRRFKKRNTRRLGVNNAQICINAREDIEWRQL